MDNYTVILGEIEVDHGELLSLNQCVVRGQTAITTHACALLITDNKTPPIAVVSSALHQLKLGGAPKVTLLNEDPRAELILPLSTP